MCAAPPLSHQNKHADFHEVKLFKVGGGKQSLGAKKSISVCQKIYIIFNGEIPSLKGGLKKKPDMNVDFYPGHMGRSKSVGRGKHVFRWAYDPNKALQTHGTIITSLIY